MKRISTLLIAALIGFTWACSPLEETAPEVFGHDSLKASIETPAVTRTSLSVGDGVSSVLWSAGDAIDVYIDGASRASVFSLTQGADTREAVFTGEGHGNKYVAMYPSGMATGNSGAYLLVNLPYEQDYKEGGFANGLFPMAASGSSSNLQFYNLMSVLRLSVTGKQRVSRIVFRSASPSVTVSGPAYVNPEEHTLTMNGGRDSLVLKVGSVQLSETVPTDFYLVLPSQTYKDGFSVRVYCGDGYMDIFYAKDFTLERSRMHKADPFVYERESGLDMSNYLEGNGTEAEPFLIQSVADLMYVAEIVNASENLGSVNASEAYYKLVADLDLSMVCNAAKGKSWVPIGSEAHQFNGVFDGDEHRITGLYINSTDTRRKNFGLFGYVGSGKVSRLTVQGSVRSAGGCAAIIAGRLVEGTIEYCVASGNVIGAGGDAGIAADRAKESSLISHCVNRATISSEGIYAGGIVSVSQGNVLTCVNEGSVSGDSYVGGITGDLEGGNIFNCSNSGEIVATSNDAKISAGGIVGNHISGVIANGRNTGAVRGNSQGVGGIAAYLYFGAKLWNCVNRGPVSGAAYLGGIAGYLEADIDYVTQMVNCVNLGAVTASGGGVAGALCGENEDGGGEKYSAVVKQSYWLDDGSLGVSTAIGHGNGDTDYLFGLSGVQMKNEEEGGSLYESIRGTYSMILDALNAYAYDNRASFGQNRLQGWILNSEDGYPDLSGLEAQKPGEEQSHFSLSTSRVDLSSAGESEFIVEVTSSTPYDVEVPEWIIQTGTRSYEMDPYTTQHLFKALANNDESYRQGKIVFREQGLGEHGFRELTVTVKQMYARLGVGETELKFASDIDYGFLTITSTVDWQISANVNWCHPELTSGSGSASVVVKVDENTSSSIRSGVLTVSDKDGGRVSEVALVQSGRKTEEAPDWTKTPFLHQSVMMRFTATWCLWCPRMYRGVQKAQELYPGHIQHIAIHGPSSDLEWDQTQTLSAVYHNAGYPSGFVDGRVSIASAVEEVVGPMIAEAVQETEETYGTVTGADIVSHITGREVAVDVNAYLKKAGNYKIVILLLEDGIHNKQEDNIGYHEDFVHDGVARLSLTNVLGDQFSVSADNSVKKFSYTASVPAHMKMQNMRVFVYIFREFGSYPVIHSADYGNWFIDNCATVQVGKKLTLQLEGSGGGTGGGNEGISPGGDLDTDPYDPYDY